MREYQTTAAMNRAMPTVPDLERVFRKRGRDEIIARSTGRDAIVRQAGPGDVGYVVLDDLVLTVTTARHALNWGEWPQGARCWPLATFPEPMGSRLRDQQTAQRVGHEMKETRRVS